MIKQTISFFSARNLLTIPANVTRATGMGSNQLVLNEKTKFSRVQSGKNISYLSMFQDSYDVSGLKIKL